MLGRNSQRDKQETGREWFTEAVGRETFKEEERQVQPMLSTPLPLPLQPSSEPTYRWRLFLPMP